MNAFWGSEGLPGRKGRDYRPVLSVVLFYTLLIVCLIMFYTGHDGNGYEEACNLCDDDKGSCGRGGLHFISYTGTLMPERPIFITAFVLAAITFASVYVPATSSLYPSAEHREMALQTERRLRMKALNSCKLGCGPDCAALERKLNNHRKLTRVLFFGLFISMFWVSCVAIIDHCLWHRAGAVLTLLFGIAWVICYTMLEIRLLPIGVTTPFHLNMKKMCCYGFVVVLVYYIVSSSLAESGPSDRTTQALGQWMTVSIIGFAFLSEQWSPRYVKYGSKPGDKESESGAPGTAAGGKLLFKDMRCNNC